jgi:hypothetical protein
VTSELCALNSRSVKPRSVGASCQHNNGGGRSCKEDACQASGESRESGYCGSRGLVSCDTGNPVAPTGIR